MSHLTGPARYQISWILRWREISCFKCCRFLVKLVGWLSRSFSWDDGFHRMLDADGMLNSLTVCTLKKHVDSLVTEAWVFKEMENFPSTSGGDLQEQVSWSRALCGYHCEAIQQWNRSQWHKNVSRGKTPADSRGEGKNYSITVARNEENENTSCVTHVREASPLSACQLTGEKNGSNCVRSTRWLTCYFHSTGVSLR